MVKRLPSEKCAEMRRLRAMLLDAWATQPVPDTGPIPLRMRALLDGHVNVVQPRIKSNNAALVHMAAKTAKTAEQLARDINLRQLRARLWRERQARLSQRAAKAMRNKRVMDAFTRVGEGGVGSGMRSIGDPSRLDLGSQVSKN